MVAKPLYENIGIGSIIKRIGECTALTNDYTLSTILTQQTPREDTCKDLCITKGSKLVIIDFKAPDVIRESERIYSYVRINAKGLEEFVQTGNFLVGFIHGALRLDVTNGSGLYLHAATPMTTIFIPLKELGNHINYTISTIKIKNIKYEYPVTSGTCNQLITLCNNIALLM
ncbi:MAG: hypothetical protein GXO43_09530 [Crenarchaeota archaeon]|nr:hypothetical protein [Thermoproteota archaeon]